MLAMGPSAQIPLNPNVVYQPRLESPQTINAMDANFVEAANLWDTTAEFLRDVFAKAL